MNQQTKEPLSQELEILQKTLRRMMEDKYVDSEDLPSTLKKG